MGIPAPPTEEENIYLMSPHSDPPPFNLLDDFNHQEEYLDTMSNKCDERFENIDRDGLNHPTSAQSTFREDSAQGKDLSDVIGLGFSTVTNTSTAETVIE